MNKPNFKREYWPTDEWQFISPENAGLNSKKKDAIESSVKSQYSNINALIVVRNGYIVYEKYFNGFNHDDIHNFASVTKSFISALIGIAIDKGYIKNVEQKVLDFFPEYSANDDDFQKKAITIKHLLTMTAPIASKTSGNRWEALDRLRRQKNWVNYILDQLGRNGQFGKFQYSTAGTHLLSAIITRATGMSAREFANKHLFQPIGINKIPEHQMQSFSLDDVFGKNVSGWINDPQGNSAGGWGLTLNARDMARFGFLYLNLGEWNGRQIISEKWIDESTSMNTNKYGYLWWLFEINGINGFSAAGSGGNHIYCIPDKDLIVVIASKIIPKPADRFPLIEKIIKL